jgi:hypothetical protein
MVQNVKLLASRRSYDFDPDEIRVTALSDTQTVLVLKQIFNFEIGQTGTPMVTFGPIQQTVPPGVVFDFGAVELSPGTTTPIRFIHVEPRRIVIDVAGPSSAIDGVYSKFREVVNSRRLLGGDELIGQASRVQNYSEMTAKLNFPPDSLLANGLADIFQSALPAAAPNSPSSVSANIRVLITPDSEEVGSVPDIPWGYHLELRTGTLPSERQYFSRAPLDSEAHISLLNALDAQLASQRVRRRTRQQ